jgi:ferredoxin
MLRRNGHDIQCHTFGHLGLRRTSAARADADCEQNRHWIADALGDGPIKHFAYPFGNVSPWVKRVLRERYATVYEVNLLRCVFCGDCEEACPTEAIVLGQDFAMADYNRRDCILTKDILLNPGEPNVVIRPE